MKYLGFLTVCVAGIVAASAPSAQATTYTGPVPASDFITFKGLNWVWASPCNPTGLGCGDSVSGKIDLSYQGTLGWHTPSYSEFVARPSPFDFVAAGSPCGSGYFSVGYTHCDYGDAEAGYLWDYGYGLTAHGSNPYAETWLVRGNSAGAVPEPAAWAMMLGGFAITGAALRRRSTTLRYA